MQHRLICVALAGLLAGCAYPFILNPRDGGPRGEGSAHSESKLVTFNLGGKIYQGTYVYDGGSVATGYSSGSSGGFIGPYAVTGTSRSSSMIYIPGSGNGRLTAFAPDGSAVRCEFTYRSGGGVGVCQDNDGHNYDMLIGSPK
jgi:hypothetical protein